MNKVIELLLQDVSNKNELKKTAVATRFCCVLLMLYYAIFAVSAICSHSYHGGMILIACIIGYGITLLQTYSANTQNACVVFDIVSIIGTSITVMWFGWNSGIQHFLFSLVLYNILFWRIGIYTQMFMAFGISMIRLALYFYCKYVDPMFIFNEHFDVFIQIISTLFVFCVIIACGINYALENQDTENKLIKYNKELEYIAATDFLTKLWNRHKMIEYMTNSLENNRNEFNSICIADIDYFKNINDTYGHKAGDAVLKRLAELFLTDMRDVGAVARWGGEEFLFFFEKHNGDEAFSKLSDIRSRVKKLVIPYEDKEIAVTLTFGLVEYDYDLNIDDNIKIADDRLYFGKENGRDQIVY